VQGPHCPGCGSGDSGQSYKGGVGQKKPDLVSTPEEVLMMIENFQGMVSYFNKTVKAGTL
jgi:hypothetical protein